MPFKLAPLSMSETPPSLCDSETSSTPKEVAAHCIRWSVNHPLGAFLWAAIFAVLCYFFGYYKIFVNGAESTARWAWLSWNAENNQEHSVVILPISIFLLWYHRNKLAAAPKQPSNAGLWLIGAGLLSFVLSVRALQPRLAVFALPLLVLGIVWFLWGKQVARVCLFPCVFLLFMIPIGGLVQGTVSLQLLVSSVCNVLASIVGVKIEASGTTIRSLDGSFNFEIAEGCSGIRSLMAMITLTALYVHFTQREIWKKIVVFGGSIIFAVIGNIGRIFTVILVARFISPKLAGGIYHDYSGFIFFPIAVAAMVSFGNVVNLNFRELLDPRSPSGEPPVKPGSSGKPSASISYDY
ncbi:MAG: eight transrane protein EpsH [Chthoniobacteraceae bacterium]|nr:eight transrane protein EpsH [Chthoniobacteraceae bacterium]